MGGIWQSCAGGRAAVVHFVGYTIPQAQNAEGRKKTSTARRRKEGRREGKAVISLRDSQRPLLPIVIETRDTLHI